MTPERYADLIDRAAKAGASCPDLAILRSLSVEQALAYPRAADWAEWAIHRLFPGHLAAYGAAVQPHLAAFGEACEPHLDAFHAATKPHRDAFHAACLAEALKIIEENP